MRFLLKVVFYCVLTVVIAACGSSDEDSALPPLPPTSTIDGNAVDALIVNGNVLVYSFKDGVKGDLLGQTETDERGYYSIALQSSTSQPILLELIGGSYVEEASGVSVVLSDSNMLRALSYFESGSSIRIMITPWTNLAVALFPHYFENGESAANAISNANSTVSGLLNLNILSTYPANITDATNASAILTDELLYGFYAAAISQLTSEISIENNRQPHTLYNSIAFAEIIFEDASYDGRLIGFDGARMAMGSHIISAHTYRRDIAAAMIRVVNDLEINKTGLTVESIIASAQAFASTSNSIFGGVTPQPIDASGPLITTNHPQGTIFSGLFDYSVNVTDPVGLASVSFSVDGEEYGSAGNINAPSVSIDSTQLVDGQHVILVSAVDAIGNTQEASYFFNVDNSAPIVTVTSNLLTNQINYHLTGIISDQTAGNFSVVVNGVDATIGENEFFADIVLEGGVNRVKLDLTDSFGNNTISEIVVNVDLFDPTFDGIYSNADFLTEAGSVINGSLEEHDFNISKLYVDYTNSSLDDVPLTEVDLIENKIAFIGVDVSDVGGGGVYSEDSDLIVQYAFSIGNEVVVDPVRLSAQVDSSRYLVPLVVEYLSNDWLASSPNDLGELVFTINDESDNQTVFTYELKTEIDIPSISVNGLFSSASIEVFDYSLGVLGGLVAGCTTDSDGYCLLPILNGERFFLLRVSGGSYSEFLNNSTVNVSEPVDFLINFENLHLPVYLSALSSFQSSFAFNKIVNNANVQDAYDYAQETMVEMFGFIPLLMPIADDLNALTFDEATQHRLTLAGWSQLALENGNDDSLYNSLTLLGSFNEDLNADDILNGVGSEGQIIFGGLAIEANTYRFGIAHAIHSYAIGQNYNTDLLPDLNDFVLSITNNTHEVFNGVEPEAFDNSAPEVTTNISGVFAGLMTFAVSATDDSAIGSVVFDIDGSVLGSAQNINSPAVDINTTLYTDGAHEIGVRATDEFSNESYVKFTVSFDNSAPVIPDNALTGTWQNGSFSFDASAVDANLTSLQVDVGGVILSGVVDINDPVVIINSNAYADGAHEIGVRAFDVSGKTSYRQFTISFDNTAPVLTIDSPILVGNFNYTISGTHTENGSGIDMVVVDSVNAVVNNSAWSLAINLSTIHTVMRVVITDIAGNSSTYEHVVDVDNLPPSMSPTYRDGRFNTSSPTDFDWLSLGRLSNGGVTETLVYENDHMTTGLDRSDWSSFNFNPIGAGDDYEKIMYIEMAIQDNQGSGVFSQPENMIVEYQYVRNGTVVKNWADAVKVNNSLAIFPLTSDLLDISYESVELSDINRLEIRLTDEAGNAVTTSYEWFAEIVAPALNLVVSKSSASIFNGLNFTSRSSAVNKNDQPIIASFANPSNKSIRVKITNATKGVFSQTYESGERKHLVNVAKGEQWRIKNKNHVRRVTYYVGPDGGTQTSTSCSQDQDYSSAVAVTLCHNEDCSNTQSLTIPGLSSESVDFESDDLSVLVVDNPWVVVSTKSNHGNFSQISYSTSETVEYPRTEYTGWGYLNNGSLSFGQCAGADDGWQARYIEAPTSVSGYPRNVFSNISEPNKNIQSVGFVVVNQDGTVQTASSDWYTVAPNDTLTIRLNHTLPSATIYNDISVGDQDLFSSYSALFYDKNLVWSFNVDLTLTSVFNDGFGSENRFTTKTIQHTSTINYSLNR